MKPTLRYLGLLALSLPFAGATFAYLVYFKAPTLSATQLEYRAPAGGADPVTSGVSLFVDGIYQTGVSFAKLPIELVKPLIIRMKLKEFVDELPLEADVLQRVHERIESKEFMDESIPFLFALKDQYTASKEDGQKKFANFISSFYSKGGSVPGLEHTLFKFPGADPANSQPVAPMDKKVIAEAVRLYDLMFLQTPASPLKQMLEDEDAIVKKVMVVVKRLLEGAVAKMGNDGEMKESLQGILAEDSRLETAALSLVRGVHAEAYKAYQMFAQKLSRKKQLEAWMSAELEKENGGKLWDYLRYAISGRRYGVHILVDGLQGHLVESLARGDYRSPFVQNIVADMRSGGGPAPSGEVKPAPAQAYSFLEYFSSGGDPGPKYLQFFKSMLRDYPNSIVKSGISTTPTISVRNIPIVQTGAPVAGAGATGIPNFHFVDRETDRAYYFFGNDALLLDELAKKAGMKTLFERLSGFNTMGCNAQYDGAAKSTFNPFLNIIVGEKSRDFSDLLCYLDLEKRAKTEVKLQEWRKKLLSYEGHVSTRASKFNVINSIYLARAQQLIGKIAEFEDDGMPQYLMYYNPWPDHFAHFKGPFSDEIISPTGELNRLDYWLSRVSGAYSAAGLSDRTLFGMAGDHGLTPVFHLVNPEIEVFQFMEKQGYPLRRIKISSDEGEGPKMTNPKHWPSMKDYDVVVASTAGGNYMMDFFAGQDEANRRRQPVYGDLVKLRTLANQTVDIPMVIAERLKESLDYFAVREEPCGVEGGVTRVIAIRDGKRVDIKIYRQYDRVFLEEADTDVLGIRQLSKYDPKPEDTSEYERLLNKCLSQAQKELPITWCDEDEWRLLTSYTDKPDSVVQLAHLYDIDRAGTVNLFPRPGIAYNSKVPGRHAGENFHEKDAFVGLWGAPAKARQRIRTAVNGSLPVTIYEYLTGEKVIAGRDGWGYRSLLGDISQ